MFTVRQSDTETIQDMSDRLDSQLNSWKLIGGNLHPQYLVDLYKSKLTPSTNNDTKKVVKEIILVAILTIGGALDSKYGALKCRLANQMVHEVDVYHKQRPQAQTLLAKYTMPANKPPNVKKKGN